MVYKPSSMENQKSIHLHNLKHDQPQPHLSGAYIRTLVKHLTNSAKSNDAPNEDPPPQPQISSALACKKQVRRRRHTTKPYQERLLNMAEARREIVTALKFHRASMKQRESTSNNNNNKHNNNVHIHSHQDHLNQVLPNSNTTIGVSLKHDKTRFVSPNLQVQHNWPVSVSTNQENLLDVKLPVQTLGLNLTYQELENLDTFNLYQIPTSSSSSSYSSSSSSSSSTLSSGGLHYAVDDEGMEEIRSLGEKHQMEWNDAVNLMASARWFEFLKGIEIEQEDGKFDGEVDHPLDCVEEFPFCMDIGEIEGMNGEWLA